MITKRCEKHDCRQCYHRVSDGSSRRVPDNPTAPELKRDILKSTGTWNVVINLTTSKSDRKVSTKSDTKNMTFSGRCWDARKYAHGPPG